MRNFDSWQLKRGVISRIRVNFPTLSRAERSVSEFVTAHASKVVGMSLMEIANASGVSDATALRFCRAIGFEGFNQMKMALVADQVSPVGAVFEAVEKGDDVPSLARKVLTFGCQLLQETQQLLDFGNLQLAIELIQKAPTVYILAVGTSTPPAETLKNQLLRLGFNVHLLTETYVQLMQVSVLQAGSVVVAISRSGSPPTLVDAVRLASSRGCQTIALTGDGNSPLAKCCDVTVAVVSHEIRSEALASTLPLVALLDVIYVDLAMRNQETTVENEERIFDALQSLKPWAKEKRVQLGLDTEGSGVDTRSQVESRMEAPEYVPILVGN